jgi:hypothetical protein
MEWWSDGVMVGRGSRENLRLGGELDPETAGPSCRAFKFAEPLGVVGHRECSKGVLE